MSMTLSSTHKGFMTLPCAVTVSPPSPTPKDSRLPERKEDRTLLPGSEFVILGLSTPSKRRPRQETKPTSRPQRPLLVKQGMRWSSSSFPAPGQRSLSGRESSVSEERWRGRGDREACTTAQPCTFCPWVGFLVLPGNWRKQSGRKRLE